MKVETLDFINSKIREYERNISQWDKRRKEYLDLMNRQELFSPTYSEYVEKILDCSIKKYELSEFIDVLVKIKMES